MLRLSILIFLISGSWLSGQATGPYAPAAGQPGSRAISKDSSIIRAWAQNWKVDRGYWDIDKPALDTVTYGQAIDAIGPVDGQVVSLGDSGVATFSLAFVLSNQDGPEFAIFENSFSDVFLELAFVEVSSNGIDFVRFPAHSLVQDSVQTAGFGATEPSLVHNFAGKYRADYGVPFDLEDLKDSSRVNINAISHIRLVDVVGAINKPYTSFDAYGNQVNDPYPTAYASGGFDLDALAFLHPSSLGEAENRISESEPYPNPSHGQIHWPNAVAMTVHTLSGVKLLSEFGDKINIRELKAGAYLLKGQWPNGEIQLRIISKL